MIFPRKIRYLFGVAFVGAICIASSLLYGQAAPDPAGDPSPFPPGPNALLVKQTCSQCHSPNVVVTRTFSKLSARKMYQKMMGESPDTERGQKIVEYLYTIMGEKDEN